MAELNIPSPQSTGSRTRWYSEMTRYHWFVLIVASLGWLFDTMDQQLFIIARGPAIEDLMRSTESSIQKQWGGYATAIFVAGWATGGLIFGALGDRFGRAKMLALTVLLYSVFTGLSALSPDIYYFCAFRFVTGLGVGGVFGLAVALVADALPDRARTNALGLLQSLSAVGNILAGLIAVFVGWLQIQSARAVAAGAEEVAAANEGSFWKYLFLVGAIPAFLCVFIQLRLKEPEKWVKAREEGKLTGARFGSYISLFGEARWRKPALLGMILCVAGVVGLWGVGFFSPELVSDITERRLQAAEVPEYELKGTRLSWTGINMIVQNIGAFLGMIAFTKLAMRYGRKPVFAFFFVAAFVSTAVTFQFLSETWHIFTLIPVMGFFQLGLFAGFAIYLPELFPTRLRSTGTSFCYNVGRFIAASGPFTQGWLTAQFASSSGGSADDLGAFRDACAIVSSVFLVGLIALLFLPETKDKPLPE